MPSNTTAETPRAPTPGRIEIRLRDSAQLFNTLDPFPFRERDLASDAERYILESAQELPKDVPIDIVLHLPAEGRGDDADLAGAIRGWFAARARSERAAITELFRDGRRAFLIGFVVLSLCLLIGWSLSNSYASPFSRVLQESFVIVGWVVIWRPAEMFLYDWLPMLRQRKLFLRLAEARVSVSR